MLRLTLAAVLCALTLGGCLPKSEFQASIQLLDEETGRPIPDAWVLPTARVITEPPVDRFDVLAAERGRTGADGVARFTQVIGLYRPDAPQDPLWKAVDAKQAALRRPGHIAGGSIVVLAAGYGLVHQPFAVEDSPAFQSWLKDNPGRAEDYGGPLGRHAVKTNLKALLLKSAGFKDGVRLTLRLRKPTSARELAETESFRLARAMWGTWHALSRQTGATEREQRAIYEFCAAQMKAVADETRDPWHREMYEAYFNAEARRKYISENHGLGPDAQNGLIQTWLTQKALEILPREAEEVKVYANEVLLGVLEEGRSPAWQNHFLDPKEPANGLPGSESALRWAGLDGDNPNNPWDWQDAQRYYREGDRRKAYLALGHVVRLLGNLAIPKYTVPDPTKETAFETAVLKVMGNNLGQLPPEYWHSVKEPAFARTPRERFETVARRTAEAGGSAWEARGPGQGGLSLAMTDLGGSDGGLGAAKARFPQAIAQGAGLLRDFYRLIHPPAYVQAPGNGNGNGGPQAVQQSSGTGAGNTTDAPGWMVNSKTAISETAEVAFDEYVEDLAAPDSHKQAVALEILASSHAAAIPALVRGLNNPNSQIRLRALRLLSGAEPQIFADKILTLSQGETNVTTRLEAIEWLSCAPSPEALRVAVDIVKSASNKFVRGAAMHEAVKLKGRGAIVWLEKHLRDHDIYLAVSAAQELATLGSDAGRATAISGLNSGDINARVLAARSLKILGQPTDLLALHQVEQDRKMDFLTRREAMQAIRHIELLRIPKSERLKHLADALSSDVATIREWASVELRDSGDTAALDLLQQTSGNLDHPGAKEATNALSTIGARVENCNRLP